jgi:hypothetical protein
MNNKVKANAHQKLGINFVRQTRIVVIESCIIAVAISRNYSFMPSALWTRSDCLMLRSSMISCSIVSEDFEEEWRVHRENLPLNHQG